MNEILYEGKSKIVYSGEDNESLLIKFKDTATAFNGKKKEELLEKAVSYTHLDVYKRQDLNIRLIRSLHIK